MMRNNYLQELVSFTLLITLLLFTACTPPLRSYTQKVNSNTTVTNQKNSPEEKYLRFTPWQKRSNILVNSGFEIEVASSADELIKGTFKVDKDGILKLPYQTDVMVRGLTPSELKSTINKAYQRILVNPQINVSIIKDDVNVEVGGLVNRPGIYAVNKNATLDELVTSAGGLLTGSDQLPQAQYVRITQGEIANTISLRDYYSGQNNLLPTWYGEEQVFFQFNQNSVNFSDNSNYVRLIGQIKMPGEYRYETDKDVYDYMILAGGPTERANMNDLTLIRENNNNKRETISFSLQESDTIPNLLPGDVIMFKADNPSQLQKDAQTVGGFSSILSSIAAVFTMIGLAF
jgi:protein involved in polysaccharide export with SLBB domain